VVLERCRRVPGGNGCLEQAWTDGVKVVRGLLQGDIGLKAAHHRQPPDITSQEMLVPSVQETLRTNRQDKIERCSDLQARKPRGRDANHFKRMIDDSHSAANGGAVTAKFALPECIAQNDAWGCAAALIVITVEQVACCRRNLQCGEDLSTRQQNPSVVGLDGFADAERECAAHKPISRQGVFSVALSRDFRISATRTRKITKWAFLIGMRFMRFPA